MPIIRANTPFVTQINVFTVPSGGQQGLIDYLAEAAKVAGEVDGWISASPFSSALVGAEHQRRGGSRRAVLRHQAAE
jgi:hypothetical protein